ncbi:MAG: hypothetical protein ACRDHX_11935 [Chloroflexota bacterium]
MMTPPPPGDEDAEDAQPLAPAEFDVAESGLFVAPPLAPSLLALFGSVKRRGRMVVPPELHLTAAFGELKLDLRDALFPEKHVLLVANSLCASLEVLLPEGVSVVDHSVAAFASHQVTQESEAHGPIIHLEGWTVFSDVKLLGAKES